MTQAHLLILGPRPEHLGCWVLSGVETADTVLAGLSPPPPGWRHHLCTRPPCDPRSPVPPGLILPLSPVPASRSPGSGGHGASAPGPTDQEAREKGLKWAATPGTARGNSGGAKSFCKRGLFLSFSARLGPGRASN